jgi:hypothetical protein
MKKIEIGKNNKIVDEKIYSELQEIIDKEINKSEFTCFMKAFGVSTVVFALVFTLLFPLLMGPGAINSISSYFKIILTILKSYITNITPLLLSALISIPIGRAVVVLQTIDNPIIELDTKFRSFYKTLKGKDYSLFYNCSKRKKKSLEPKFEKVYNEMFKKYPDWFKENQYSFRNILTNLSFYEKFIKNKMKIIDQFKDIDGDIPVVCNDFNDALEYSVFIDGKEITFEDHFALGKILENGEFLTKSEAFDPKENESVENPIRDGCSRKDTIEALNKERTLLVGSVKPKEDFESEKKYVLYVNQEEKND